MKPYLVLISTILGFVACKPKDKNNYRHELISSGDSLKIVYRGEGDLIEFKMFEGLSCVLEKKSDGIFEGNLLIENLKESIFSYEITIHNQSKNEKLTQLDYKPKEYGENYFLWIGNNRKDNYKKSKELEGSMHTQKINSQFLGETRNLTFYEPKNSNDSIPIFYLVDGQVVEFYAPYIDQLITDKIISPIILVGIHSSKIDRYSEYVDGGVNNELFIKHQNFFNKEVIVEAEKNIRNWKGKRYLFGFSNGAAFCIHAGMNHPELYEEIIAFSTAGYIIELERPIEFKFSKYPKFYLAAGRYEEIIFIHNKKFVDKLKSKKIDVNFKELIAGHDYNVWKIEFLEYLEKRFKT